MSDPTRLELELLALGELDGERAAEVRAKLASDGDLAGRYARIRRELAPERPLPELVLPARGEERASGVRWPRWASLAGIAVAVAAGVLLWARSGPSGEAFRGALDLEVVRIRAGVAEPQGAVVRAREGDRLQLAVAVDAPGFVSVFDVQDDGAVATWLDAAPIRPGEPVTAAAILDDYPGLERVFVVVGDAPLPAAAFERAVRGAWSTPLADLDALPGLEGVAQRSVTILEDP